MNPLQELIRRRMDEQAWSYADVARRGGLPRSTVHHLANNARPSRPPHPQTLSRLAEGLDLPRAQVHAAAEEAANGAGADAAAAADLAPADIAAHAVAADSAIARLTAELGRLSAEELQQVADFVHALRAN